MRKLYLLFALSLIFGTTAFAQNGKFNGMGNASVALFDVWGVNNNQAGLAKLEESQLSALYEDKYNTKQTATQSFVYVLHTKSGNFALTYNHLGYSAYSENTGGLAYARTLGRYVTVGVQFDLYYYHQSEDYGNEAVALMELGMVVEPIEKLAIGVHFFNPTKSKLVDYQDERIETNFRFGLSYYFVDEVLFAVEVAKGLDTETRYKAGLEYEPITNFYLRTGIASNPTQYTFGTGYAYEHFAFDLSFATHPQLPLSSQLSMKYFF